MPRSFKSESRKWSFVACSACAVRFLRYRACLCPYLDYLCMSWSVLLCPSIPIVRILVVFLPLYVSVHILTFLNRASFFLCKIPLNKHLAVFQISFPHHSCHYLSLAPTIIRPPHIPTPFACTERSCAAATATSYIRSLSVNTSINFINQLIYACLFFVKMLSYSCAFFNPIIHCPHSCLFVLYCAYHTPFHDFTATHPPPFHLSPPVWIFFRIIFPEFWISSINAMNSLSSHFIPDTNYKTAVILDTNNLPFIPCFRCLHTPQEYQRPVSSNQANCYPFYYTMYVLPGSPY